MLQPQCDIYCKCFEYACFYIFEYVIDESFISNEVVGSKWQIQFKIYLKTIWLQINGGLIEGSQKMIQ